MNSLKNLGRMQFVEQFAKLFYELSKNNLPNWSDFEAN